MAIFSSNKPANSEFKRDHRKAERFFEHAQTVADTHNFDYAVECYINGLRHDPDNMAKHEALREVSLKRKVAGGKSAPIGEKLKRPGKDPIERLLRAERLWAKDPLNVSLMVEVTARAVEADEAEQELHLGELAYWVGSLVLEMNQGAKKPSKDLYVKVRDLFTRIGAYDKAVEACRLAVQLDPQNGGLIHDLKNLEAELAIHRGGFEERGVEEGGSRQLVRDMDKQKALEQEESISKTVSDVEQIIERRRAEYEQSPDDLDVLKKLVAALVQRETDESEAEAIDLLTAAHERTGQYRFKVEVGDIRIKQMNRQFRKLRLASEAAPEDPGARREMKEFARRKVKFELGEYRERVKNYPTDLALKFELGRRLFALKQYDEAIGAFQQSKTHPKHRAASHDYLGRCYLEQGWFDEAIETFRKGIESHPLSDDRLALELRYQLMQALRGHAEKHKDVEFAKEAQSIGSQVLQTDINFKDIRKQMDELRALGQSLREGA